MKKTLSSSTASLVLLAILAGSPWIIIIRENMLRPSQPQSWPTPAQPLLGEIADPASARRVTAPSNEKDGAADSTDGSLWNQTATADLPETLDPAPGAANELAEQALTQAEQALAQQQATLEAQLQAQEQANFLHEQELARLDALHGQELAQAEQDAFWAGQASLPPAIFVNETVLVENTLLSDPNFCPPGARPPHPQKGRPGLRPEPKPERDINQVRERQPSPAVIARDRQKRLDFDNSPARSPGPTFVSTRKEEAEHALGRNARAPRPREDDQQNAAILAEQQRQQLAARQQQELAERQRLVAEQAEQQRQAMVERQRQAAEAAERQRQELAERQRLAEEHRAELQRRQVEMQRQAEQRQAEIQQRQVEMQRQAAEMAERQRQAAEQAERLRQAAEVAEQQRRSELAERQRQAAEAAQEQRQQTAAAENARRQQEAQNAVGRNTGGSSNEDSHGRSGRGPFGR